MNSAVPDFSVRDQVVFVSGGTRSIGRAIAAAFSAAGAKVVLTGRRSEDAAAAAASMSSGEQRVLGLGCDVADPPAVETAVGRTLDEFGRIDALINVAGINIRKPAVEFTLAEFDAVMGVNLRGAFYLSQVVGSHMLARGGGCQINIASLNSDRPLKNVAPYAMSKAALSTMTRALALEWGEAGVRVNAIAPGFILTDLTRKLWSDEIMRAWGVANTPARRLGQPEDLVGAALFLASDAAAFMTGQTIYVDGGFTAGWAWPIPQPPVSQPHES